MKTVVHGFYSWVRSLAVASLRELDVLEEENAPVFSPKMKSVYLFSSPSTYFKTIDYMIMLISFYLSLWICNFLPSSDIFEAPDRDVWKVYSLLPGLASLVTYAYIIRASSFLLV
jgi:hypothetical protein